MGIFGWSYPPGCSGTPADYDMPCAVCGRGDDCICAECPECGCQGDPTCYERHGMIRTPEQIKSIQEIEAIWKAEADAEAAWQASLIDPEQFM